MIPSRYRLTMLNDIKSWLKMISTTYDTYWWIYYDSHSILQSNDQLLAENNKRWAKRDEVVAKHYKYSIFLPWKRKCNLKINMLFPIYGRWNKMSTGLKW